MLDLYLIRGLPGSGKSSFAEKLSVEITSADDFFMKDGQYKFDPSKLTEAHQACQARTEFIMKAGNDVAVTNTFTQRWEMEPYILLAKKYKARLTVVDLYDGGLDNKQLALRNIHNVPEEGISSMRSRYEYDWKAGNPIPPWDRKEEPKPKPAPKPQPKEEVSAQPAPQQKVETPAPPKVDQPKPVPKPAEPKPEPKPKQEVQAPLNPKPDQQASNTPPVAEENKTPKAEPKAEEKKDSPKPASDV
jgi:predicted kinase